MRSIETSKEFILTSLIKILQIFLILANFTINSHRSMEQIFLEILSYAMIGLAISEAANNSRIVAELLQHQVLKRSQIIMRVLQTIVACFVVLITMYVFGSKIAYLSMLIILLNMSLFSFVSVVLRGFNKLYLSQLIWIIYWFLSLLLQLQLDPELAIVTSSFCIALFSVIYVYSYIDFEFEFDNVTVKYVMETSALGATGIIDALVRRVDILILLKIASSTEVAAYYLLQKNFEFFNLSSQSLKTVYLRFQILADRKNVNFILITVIWLIFMYGSYHVYTKYIFTYFSSYIFNFIIFILFGISGLLTYYLTPIGLTSILDKKYRLILLSSVLCLLSSCVIWWIAIQIDHLEVFALALPIGILSQILTLRMLK